MRQLEGEVRVLKESLDTREEQLDMVSRIHSFSPYSPTPSSTSSGPHRAVTRASSVAGSPSSVGDHDDQDDCFTIQEPAFFVNDGASRFYLGSSSGLPFVGTLNAQPCFIT